MRSLTQSLHRGPGEPGPSLAPADIQCLTMGDRVAPKGTGGGRGSARGQKLIAWGLRWGQEL